MNTSLGLKPRPNLRLRGGMKTPTRMGNTFKARRGSPAKNLSNNAEEFKRNNRIGQDFEKKAEEFFTTK